MQNISMTSRKITQDKKICLKLINKYFEKHSKMSWITLSTKNVKYASNPISNFGLNLFCCFQLFSWLSAIFKKVKHVSIGWIILELQLKKQFQIFPINPSKISIFSKRQEMHSLAKNQFPVNFAPFFSANHSDWKKCELRRR